MDILFKNKKKEIRKEEAPPVLFHADSGAHIKLTAPQEWPLSREGTSWPCMSLAIGALSLATGSMTSSVTLLYPGPHLGPRVWQRERLSEPALLRVSCFQLVYQRRLSPYPHGS